MATILFGGSFDPIHNGHLAMAKAAMAHLPDARLLLIPAACSPFKTDNAVTDQNHRLAMCRAAVGREEKVQVTDLEFHLPPPSYTIHTVRRLQSEMPDTYYFLCGADAFLSLALWKDYSELLKRVTFLVAHRKGFHRDQLLQQKEWVEQQGGKTVFLPMEQVVVSSSQIRQALLDGQSAEPLVPPEVWRYIQENGLYQE